MGYLPALVSSFENWLQGYVVFRTAARLGRGAAIKLEVEGLVHKKGSVPGGSHCVPLQTRGQLTRGC